MQRDGVVIPVRVLPPVLAKFGYPLLCLVVKERGCGWWVVADVLLR